MDEATSALDAESETLVNEALASLLRGNNTTISIAHRLSTIKRSDHIIVLSSDGTVAEMGSYKDLSSRPDGAFTKLMEWQMSGGDTNPNPRINVGAQGEELEDSELGGPRELEDSEIGGPPPVEDETIEDDESLTDTKEEVRQGIGMPVNKREEDDGPK